VHLGEKIADHVVGDAVADDREACKLSILPLKDADLNLKMPMQCIHPDIPLGHVRGPRR
jgi:hypothetical protein